MSYSAPLELLTDAVGSVTFGWMEEGVYYARFSRALSARLGEAFAGRLRAAAQGGKPLKYFADGRALETYDLLARSAFVRVVSEHRRRFEGITILSWTGVDVNQAFLSALGDPVRVTKDADEFEKTLYGLAPRARLKLEAKQEARPRTRWPLRR